MTNTMSRQAFTLLEVMAVVTLLAITVGIATVGASGLADEARVSTAVSQIGSVYRLAACEATRSGLPRLLELGRHGCVVKKPVYRDDLWIWSSAPQISLIRGITIVRVFPLQGEDATAPSDPPWEILISPGPKDTGYGLVLQLGNAIRARCVLDGLAGARVLEFEGTEYSG